MKIFQTNSDHFVFIFLLFFRKFLSSFSSLFFCSKYTKYSSFFGFLFSENSDSDNSYAISYSINSSFIWTTAYFVSGSEINSGSIGSCEDVIYEYNNEV